MPRRGEKVKNKFTFIRFLKDLERFRRCHVSAVGWLLIQATHKIISPSFRTIRWQKSPNTTQQEVATKLKDRAPTIPGK